MVYLSFLCLLLLLFLLFPGSSSGYVTGDESLDSLSVIPTHGSIREVDVIGYFYFPF
jgi:hypothetical protein